MRLIPKTQFYRLSSKHGPTLSTNAAAYLPGKALKYADKQYSQWNDLEMANDEAHCKRYELENRIVT